MRRAVRAERRVPSARAALPGAWVFSVCTCVYTCVYDTYEYESYTHTVRVYTILLCVCVVCVACVWCRWRGGWCTANLLKAGNFTMTLCDKAGLWGSVRDQWGGCGGW